MSVLSCPVLTTMTTMFTTTTMTMAEVGQAVLCQSTPSLAKKKRFFLLKIFQSFMFFLMFCNVFLPQTVFESLKGLTVVETIYKKSGSDQIFLLELATYHLESTTKQVT